MFLLVVLAGLGVYAVTIGTSQRAASTLSILGARAHFAAHSGMEWAVQAALNDPAALNCGGPGPQFTLGGGAAAGYRVGVACDATTVDEGGSDYTVYALVVTAGRGAAGEPGFVSRTLRATVADQP